jgi:hypothetical protein
VANDYEFEEVGTGRRCRLDFETMMRMDAAGFVTLENGVEFRRVRDAGGGATRKTEGMASGIDPPMVSDAMGFPRQQIAEYEEHRKRHGFKSVEFQQDPSVPEFVQVRFHNRKERDRYMAHRQMFDKNSRNGSAACLSPAMLEKAAKRVAMTLDRGE